MANNTISCERCGGTARFIEGRFDVVDGSIQMLSGPEWSWDLVAELRLALRRIVDDPPNDPVRELAKVNKPFAYDVKIATRGMSRSDKLSVFMALWAAMSTDYPTLAANLQAVAKVLEYVAAHGIPPHAQ